MEATRVLDLGCGSGRDAYALAQMVGPEGGVVGVDMTDEQLAVAEKYVEWHRERFGYASSNTRFLKGYIEKLPELDLPPSSFDVIVSNCVVNLSPDKGAVLRGAYDLLKPGGEMYFADVYVDRRLDEDIKQQRRRRLAEELREDNKMPRAGDGEKLRQPLQRPQRGRALCRHSALRRPSGPMRDRPEP